MSCEFVESKREGVCAVTSLTTDTIRELNHRYHDSFEQTTNLLLKVADRFASNILAGALKELKTSAKTSILGLMDWGEPAGGGGLFTPSAVAAGSGADWVWTLVGLLIVGLLAQTGYMKRAAVARAARYARDRLRRRHAPPPPQRPRPLALSTTGPPPPPLPFIRFASPAPSTSLPTIGLEVVEGADSATPSYRPRRDYSTPPLSPEPGCSAYA
uniref:Uncharacterized protein n=1 Tax=Plectus sambesii TaxID=2011161 RepID=A0A914WKK5_9BILA